MTERLTVSVPEAAKMLGISKNSAYNAVARGSVPSLRIGKRIVVPLAALRRILECQNQQASQGQA